MEVESRTEDFNLFDRRLAAIVETATYRYYLIVMCLTRKRRLKFDISYGRVLRLKRYKTYGGYRHARVIVFVVDSHDKHGGENTAAYVSKLDRIGLSDPYGRVCTHACTCRVSKRNAYGRNFRENWPSRRHTRYVRPGTDRQNVSAWENR